MNDTRAPTHYQFRLYVAGHTLNSVRAISNLNAICREYFECNCEIEVVDVLKNPERALLDRIMMTPTLLRLEPAPPVRIIGSLSTPAVVLEALQISVDRQPA